MPDVDMKYSFCHIRIQSPSAGFLLITPERSSGPFGAGLGHLVGGRARFAKWRLKRYLTNHPHMVKKSNEGKRRMNSESAYGDLALSGYRALDLTDEKGMLCGKILADLGAEVIKVERPGGDRARQRDPYYHDIPHPEKSLFWWAYNIGKRGVTLDLECADGQDIFKRLAKGSDIVIESFPPGHMGGRNLDYSALKELNPGIIMVSITPFGQTGPYKDYKGCDLVCMAMGGPMYLTGDPGKPPLRIGHPQAFLHASAQAAVGALLALYHRETGGEGQWVDVSAQQSVVACTLNAVPFWELNNVLLQRAGLLRSGMSGGTKQRQTWPCKDGFVAFVMIGGGHGAKTNRRLVSWMQEEGYADDFLKGIDWDVFDMTALTQEVCDRMESLVGKFFLANTKQKLYESAISRGIMLYPVSSPKDIVEDVQLASREYWESAAHPELDSQLTYPGGFAKYSDIPKRSRRRAPLIGESNQEIYERELGLSQKEMSTLRQAGVI